MSCPLIILAATPDSWCNDLFLAGFAQSIDRPVRILLRRDPPNVKAVGRWVDENPDALVILGAGENHARTYLRSLIKPTISVEFTPSDEDDDLAVDETAVGRAAADHLLARGVRHASFIVSGTGGRQRGDGFLRHFAAHGLLADTIRLPEKQPEHGLILRHWLERLPPASGAFCYNDQLAFSVAITGEKIGIRIGSDLLLLGADNHPFLCFLARPPLSSVQVPHFEIGASAWRQLVARLDGARAIRQRIAPAGVQERESTIGTLISDSLVTNALAMIAARLGESLPVERLSKLMGTPRRTLERRFRAALGRGLHEEILRVRLERARDLLANGDQALDSVALACGFSDVTGLHRAFRRTFAMSPGAWRDRYRIAAKSR